MANTPVVELAATTAADVADGDSIMVIPAAAIGATGDPAANPPLLLPSSEFLGGGTAPATWAEDGNTDAIPASKLTNAPSGEDAATWAEEGNTDAIPAAKLSNAPSGEEIEELLNEIDDATGRTLSPQTWTTNAASHQNEFALGRAITAADDGKLLVICGSYSSRANATDTSHILQFISAEISCRVFRRAAVIAPAQGNLNNAIQESVIREGLEQLTSNSPAGLCIGRRQTSNGDVVVMAVRTSNGNSEITAMKVDIFLK